MPAKKEVSFEKAITELESIIDELEKGDLTLEQNIALYQKGMNLSKLCHEKLTQAQLQLEEVKYDDI